MRKIFIPLVMATVLFADISNIITALKEIESFKPVFQKMPAYNVFTKINTISPQPEAVTFEKKVILKLNAVFMNKANINGVWLKKGDEIEGYKVIDIKSNEVVLLKNGKIKILKNKSNILKVVK